MDSAAIKKKSKLPSIIKWPTLGFYSIIKFVITFLVDIFKNFFKGLYVVFVRNFTLGFQTSSSNVDRAYKKTKVAVNESKITKVLSMEVGDLFSQLWFIKKRHEQLEKERQKLQKTLQSEEAKRTELPLVYKYVVKNHKGKFESGTFIGVSLLDVNAFLLNEGYEVYSIKTSKTINFVHGQSSGLFAKKMSNQDLIFWLSQLSTYLKSGITLVDSVRILAKQMGVKNRSRKRIFDALVYELTLGESFSNALEKQGTTFPQLLINMLRAAEATGDLIGSLDEMVSYYTEIDNTKKQMISAITYPSILLVFAFLVISFVMLYVIPQFVDIYEQSGVAIAGLTATIIDLAIWFRENLIVIITLLLIALAVIGVLYRQLKAFRSVVQTILMRVPLIGNIIIYNELTIFTKTFSSLLKNNVFITDSMDLLSKLTSNEIYKNIMFNTINNIAKGDKISLSFHNHWAIPDIAYYMIVTGESTGELASTMQRVSEYYQGQHRSIITNLKSFIEPLMIIMLALIVGIVILAVIVPMFDLYGTIQI